MNRKQSREEFKKARFEEAIAKLGEQLPPAIVQEAEEPKQKKWPKSGTKAG